MVGSDPHVGFEAVSCWYNVHLHGGSFDVVGCAYVGVPAVMFGRNENVAWGITNNICSQRDLFWETVDEQGRFLHDGAWEESTKIDEVIYDKNGEVALVLPVVFSRHGPIVNQVRLRRSPHACSSIRLRCSGWPHTVTGGLRQCWPWIVRLQSLNFANRSDPGIAPASTSPLPTRTDLSEWSASAGCHCVVA